MSTKFRSDIQGLRAIAVASVVIFHYFPAALPGGFTGVDIFFVISGFLITQSLLKEVDQPLSTLLANFYRRRIRRIFPALFLMLGTCLIVGGFLMFAPAFSDLASSAAASALFVSNFYFLATTSYFADAAERKPLLHTWSLSIEEQFYILFPILLFFAFRHMRRHVFALLLGMTLLLFLFSEAVVLLRPSLGYYFTGARAFELAIGCVLAVVPGHFRLSQAAAQGLAAAGVVAMLLGFVILTETSHFPGIGALLPCLGAAAVLFAGAHRETATGRLLSLPPMRFLGDVSYSYYLWHWPPLAFLRYYYGPSLSVSMLLAAMAASLVVAWLSYRFVEQLFLRKAAAPLPYLGLGAGLVGAASAISLAIVALGGVPQRFPAQINQLADARNDFSPMRATCHNDFQHRFAYDGACIFGQDKAKPKPIVAVFGDSHGAEIAYALGELAKTEDFAVSEITTSSCPPAPGFATKERPGCIAHNAQMLPALVQDERVKVVVLTIFMLSDIYNATPADREKLEAGLSDTLAQLRRGGKQVIIMLPVPTYDFDPPIRMALRARMGLGLEDLGKPRAAFDAESAHAIAFLRRIAAEHDAQLFDPTPALCDSRTCQLFSPKVGPLYFNSTHVSMAGNVLLAQRLAPMIEGELHEQDRL